ncbi:type I pantothenate kinase [Lactobacillus sp. S2-2]|uniref:type I pantothenate kinase n=1 Tax=Lactobacillus sp. S2-2 TaxID=2692917 RepID=UPI001F02BFE2|nr:type I pantothenate kinase [Lactobacillus sp. S2-2]MCF6514738.1 type I pantothenate kinase [Lactobacillus sp. S2-2]
MAELDSYNRFTRTEWNQFGSEYSVPVTEDVLAKLKAFNDKITLKDVDEIYIPLINLLRLSFEKYQNWQKTKQDFTKVDKKKVPFIIGISGSVAVGKSTTARLLQYLLKNYMPNFKTNLITTDGFLYPSKILKEKNLMKKKGFPESYDMQRLVDFLTDVKLGKDNVKAPIYSHESYDIIPDEYINISNPDILIIEGINTLQIPKHTNIYVSDFTNFSIYIDAKTEIIETWYLDRFKKLLQTALKSPDNYYYKYAVEEPEKTYEMAKDVWHRINLPNLNENILPTRSRADLIMHKSFNHEIDEIYLKKY